MKKSKSKVGFHKIAGATRVVIKNGKKTKRYDVMKARIPTE